MAKPILFLVIGLVSAELAHHELSPFPVGLTPPPFCYVCVCVCFNGRSDILAFPDVVYKTGETQRVFCLFVSSFPVKKKKKNPLELFKSSFLMILLWAYHES